MLSKKLKNIFDEMDKKDPASKRRSSAYKIFLSIASELTHMREAKGLSQRELAERLATSHPTINRWETEGYTGYTLAKLIEIADVLDYNVELTFVAKNKPQVPTHCSRQRWSEAGGEDLFRNWNLKTSSNFQFDAAAKVNDTNGVVIL